MNRLCEYFFGRLTELQRHFLRGLSEGVTGNEDLKVVCNTIHPTYICVLYT